MATYTICPLDMECGVLLSERKQTTGKLRMMVACLAGLSLGLLVGTWQHSGVSHRIITSTNTQPIPVQQAMPVQQQAPASNMAKLTAATVATIGAAAPAVANAAPFESLGVESSPLYQYFNLFTPIVDALGDNSALVHWLHPVNMGIVLFAMGGYGTYLGWQIRNRRLAGNPEPVQGIAGASHPLLMAVMALLFFLGAQGGLLFTLYEGRPLLASDHATTAVISLTFLGAQALIGRSMGDNEGKRTLHAYFGSAIMALLVVHAIFGLNLGLST